MEQLEYLQIGRWLKPWEMAKFIGSVESSGIFEIADESVTGKLNHIVLVGEKHPVAYFGADNQVELVNPGDDSLKVTRAYLIGLYEGCLDENQRTII